MTHPEIIFMRHGETEWNLAGRAQGRLDSPLTEKGRLQATRLGEILVRELQSPGTFEQMVSPLGRTLETAHYLQRNFDFKPIKSDLLMEIDVGRLSGLTKSEMLERYPEHMAGKNGNEWYFGAPGGETLQQMRERAGTWLAGLVRPTIAVAHGQIGKVIRGIVLGLDDHQIHQLSEPQGVVHVLKEGRETIWT